MVASAIVTRCRSLAVWLYHGIVDGEFDGNDGEVREGKISVALARCVPDGDDLVILHRVSFAGAVDCADIGIEVRNKVGNLIGSHTVIRGSFGRDGTAGEPRVSEVLASTRVRRCDVPLRLVAFDRTGTLKPGTRVLNVRRCRNMLADFAQQTCDASCDEGYREWLAGRCQPDDAPGDGGASLFTLVLVMDEGDSRSFSDTVESVCLQDHNGWELVLVTRGVVGDQAVHAFSEVDGRIRVVPCGRGDGRAECVKRGIDAATGDYVAVLRQGDTIEHHALSACASRLADVSEPIDALYCDEDSTNGEGVFSRPFFKPDFNKGLLYSLDYLSGFLLARKAMLADAAADAAAAEQGGFTAYALALGVAERTTAIAHIPRVLLHVRAVGRDAGASADRARSEELALEGHFRRAGLNAAIERCDRPGLRRVRFIPDGSPKVSIVIPSKDHVEDLSRCITSITEKATYGNYEIVVVENNSAEESTFEFYQAIERDPRIRVVRFGGPFNYSRVVNFGVASSDGDLVLLLNNDTEVITADFLERMVGLAQLDDVGVVGAQLLYFDGLVQHAGVVMNLFGEPYHVMTDVPAEFEGRFGQVGRLQDFSAVTGACQMVSRAVYEELGGYDESLAVCYNDVDFCLKARAAGYRVVYDPAVQLHHGEFTSRGRDVSDEAKARFKREYDVLKERWPRYFEAGDPYYNCNLDRESAYYALSRGRGVNPCP